MMKYLFKQSRIDCVKAKKLPIHRKSISKLRKKLVTIQYRYRRWIQFTKLPIRGTGSAHNRMSSLIGVQRVESSEIEKLISSSAGHFNSIWFSVVADSHAMFSFTLFLTYSEWNLQYPPKRSKSYVNFYKVRVSWHVFARLFVALGHSTLLSIVKSIFHAQTRYEK